MSNRSTKRVHSDAAKPAASSDAEESAAQTHRGLPLLSVQRESSNAPPPSPHRRWRAVLGLIILSAIVAWAFRDSLADVLPLPRADQPPPAAPTIMDRIFALGRLEPEGEVIAVAAPSGAGDARIEAVQASLGQHVEKGQVLAILDNRDRLHAAHMVAQAQLQQAQRQVEQTILATSTLRQQLVASLEARKAEAEFAQSELKRQRMLRQSRAVSIQELEQAVLAANVAEKTVGEAEAKLARYHEDVEHSTDVLLAVAQVRVAEAAVAEAAARLEQAFVRAPVDGAILDIDLRPGERISNSTILKMGRTDSMFVRAEIYESDIAQITAGQSVEIRAPAIEQVLRGKVATVATFVQQQSVVDADPAANTDARVIEVFVRLDEASSQIAEKLVGMQVQVAFEL